MEAFLPYIFKSAGILAIFFLSYQLLLKKETFFRTNRHFLLAGILASLLLPFVVFTKYIYVEAEPFNPLWLLADTNVNANVITEPEPFDWAMVLPFIYITVTLIFAVRFLIQLISLFKLIKTYGIKKINGFKLVEATGDVSPFSFFNYIVFNPEKYNQDDLKVILNHEKAHGKQLHSIDVIIAQLLVIVQWFNPIAWLYKKSIQQNLEFMADQTAIAKVSCTKHYQHTLLKASLKPQYASITNNFYNSLIKKRIVMLNQSKSNIKNSWKYFVILPSLTLFLMSFNVKTVEVVKEAENSDINLDSMFFSDESQPENAIKTEPKASAPVVSKMQNENAFIQEDIKIKIHKNSTDKDLKEIADNLKKEGIDFSVTNIKRNSNNEITGLQVKYKDSNGNSGNYSLNGDEPINTFYFYKEADGSIGFASEGMSEEQREKLIEAREMAKEKRMEMAEKRKEMLFERQEEMEARRQEMEKRREEIEERREEIEVRVREAREHQKEAMEKQRKNYEVIIKERKQMQDSMRIKRQVFINRSKLDNDVLYILDGDEVEMEEIKLLSPDKIQSMNVLKGDNAFNIYGKEGENGVIVITTKAEGNHDIEFDFDDTFNGKNKTVTWFSNDNAGVSTISKNTSDSELKEIKNDLESKNITFKYNKVKRNDAGEITRIKVSLNDDQGNKSSSTFDTGDKGINPILIGKNNKNLIIKSI